MLSGAAIASSRFGGSSVGMYACKGSFLVGVKLRTKRNLNVSELEKERKKESETDKF